MRKRKGNKGWGSFVQTLILITYALDGVKEDLSSGGSKPSDNGGGGWGGGGGGGGPPDPQGRGGGAVSRKLFLGPSGLSSKSKGGPSPRSVTTFSLSPSCGNRLLHA